METELYNRVYNREVKALFLDEIENENTKKAYLTLFSQISEIEKLYHKDIFDFTIEQLTECLETLQKTTFLSAASSISKVVSYWKWAINPGKFTKNNLPLSWLMSKKTEDLVPKTALENSYISEDEMYEIVEQECENAIDGAEVMLIYRNVYGYQMSELKFLKESNIDFANNIVKIEGTVKINNEIIDSSRILQLSDRDMAILKEAVEEKKYVKRDKNIMDDINKENQDEDSYRVYDLMQSEYLFKYLDNKRNEDKIGLPIDNNKLTMRLKKIFKNHRKPQVNAKKIIMSAMINDIMELNKNLDEISYEEYVEILKKYWKDTRKPEVNRVKINNLKKNCRLLLNNKIIKG